MSSVPASGRWRGNAIASGSPSRASASSAGPPGNGRSSSRAVLSKASPAASSRVLPITRSVERRAHLDELRVPARDEQREKRVRRRLVALEKRREEVAVQVVDRVERQAGRERERLGRRDADDEAADQPGSGGDRDPVELARARRLRGSARRRPRPRAARRGGGWRSRARSRRTSRGTRPGWSRRSRARARRRARPRSRCRRTTSRSPAAARSRRPPPAPEVQRIAVAPPRARRGDGR